jgi:cytosine/adenosine deaminase-related metal-dependent hydrolase/ubiquinone/menaquinone biosynthesis C-methylase UbiE
MGSAAKVATTTQYESQRKDFALWSQTYDELPNPLLALEERFLAPLLADVSGKRVLDVGCGTGRWLEHLADLNPGRLTGVDFSPEMLVRAARRLGRRAAVAAGDATLLPVAASSADIVVASFVAGYVASMEGLANELRRVVAANGRVYLSDIHPETAAACHWKRGFRSGDRQVEPHNSLRSLPAIVWLLRNAGFRVACLFEPVFGAPEREIFRRAGKLDAFGAAEGLPAIYILEIRPAPQASVAGGASRSTEHRLQGARITINGDAATIGDLEMRDGRVNAVGAYSRLRSGAAEGACVHLNGYLLIPGLINAHDHLEFGLYPNLGRGGYRNSKEWAEDIQRREQETIAAYQSIAREVRLWWGGIRNLLCGVTTVCHHNPLHEELLDPEFPVRVVTDYGWAHSLAMDAHLGQKRSEARAGAPFVVHACEGTDEGSAQEVFELDELGALDERAVLVHGLALGANGIARLNERGATLVWCPSSNRFLFGRTLELQSVRTIRRLLLGSDSPLTAAGDLLDEVRIAHEEVGLSAHELFDMLFERAAKAFRLKDGQGKIRPNARADLVAVRDKGLSPAETVARLTAADVEMVMVGGQVRLASEEIFRRLPAELAQQLRPMEVGSMLRWVRAPLGRLFREAERGMGREIKLGGRQVRHVCSAWI